MKPIRIFKPVVTPSRVRRSRPRMVAATLAIIVLGFGVPGISQAQAPDIADAPKAMQEVARSIQGKKPDQVRAALIKRFGPAQRDVGSGFRIEQWDLPDGMLTFHPGLGPTFFEAKTSKFFRLIRTANPLRANLFESYEMFTLPDPKNHDTAYWLGNLRFGPGSTYRFDDSGQNLGQRDGQKENFFMLHPAGKVEVRYHAPITEDTLLETLADGTPVADLTFISDDGKERVIFSIVTSESERRLAFSASQPVSFRMDTGWKNFWR